MNKGESIDKNKEFTDIVKMRENQLLINYLIINNQTFKITSEKFNHKLHSDTLRTWHPHTLYLSLYLFSLLMFS